MYFKTLRCHGLQVLAGLECIFKKIGQDIRFRIKEVGIIF